MKKLFPLLTLLLAYSFVSAQTVIFTDDFESYTVGLSVGTQSNEWFPWTGAIAEDALVSSAQNHSVGGSKSMNVIAGNDIVYSFGNRTTGAFTVDFWYYVATGNQAHINLQHAFGVEWAFEANFANGILSFDQGSITTYPYPQDTWFHVTLSFNLDDDFASINIDGADLTSWQFSTQQDCTPGMNQLGCINFFGPALNNYFIDDFTFTSLEVDPFENPCISIDYYDYPIIALWDNFILPIDLPFANICETDLVYIAYPKFDDPLVTSSMISDTMNYDGANVSAIGWQESYELYAAVRFQNDKTSLHIGQEIESVDIYINDLPIGDITVYVWSKGGFINPGTTTVLSEKTFTPVAESWNTITLINPVRVTGDEIWVGYKFTTPTSGNTLGIDNTTVIPKTNYLKTGATWDEYNSNGNFNIRANVTGSGWPVWLSVTPFSGILPPYEEQILTLEFDNEALPFGRKYYASVVIGCNDYEQEWSEIPVILDFHIGLNNATKYGVMTYPNPATQNINVVSDASISSISVYSITGQFVKSFKVNATTTSIDVSNMLSGMYIMEVNVGNEVVKSKFVVK